MSVIRNVTAPLGSEATEDGERRSAWIWPVMKPTGTIL